MVVLVTMVVVKVMRITMMVMMIDLGDNDGEYDGVNKDDDDEHGRW